VVSIVGALGRVRAAGRSGCEIIHYWTENHDFSVSKVYIVAISDQKMQQIAAGSAFSTENNNSSTEKRLSRPH
jgi:hypothetical protein